MMLYRFIERRSTYHSFDVIKCVPMNTISVFIHEKFTPGDFHNPQNSSKCVHEHMIKPVNACIISQGIFVPFYDQQHINKIQAGHLASPNPLKQERLPNQFQFFCIAYIRTLYICMSLSNFPVFTKNVAGSTSVSERWWDSTYQYPIQLLTRYIQAFLQLSQLNRQLG